MANMCCVICQALSHSLIKPPSKRPHCLTGWPSRVTPNDGSRENIRRRGSTLSRRELSHSCDARRRYNNPLFSKSSTNKTCVIILISTSYAGRWDVGTDQRDFGGHTGDSRFISCQSLTSSLPYTKIQIVTTKYASYFRQRAWKEEVWRGSVASMAEARGVKISQERKRNVSIVR
jgi:hypothetical protein